MHGNERISLLPTLPFVTFRPPFQPFLWPTSFFQKEAEIEIVCLEWKVGLGLLGGEALE